MFGNGSAGHEPALLYDWNQVRRFRDDSRRDPATTRTSSLACTAIAVDHAADVERSAVRSLEHAAGRTASACAFRTFARPARRQSLGGGHTLSHDLCGVPRDAAAARAIGVPGTQCADLCDVSRKAGSVLL